jgi:hypothetical protein
MFSPCYIFIAIVLTGFTWNMDHHDKYPHPFDPHPSIERDQPTNVGCGQKSRSVDEYRALVG